MAQQKLSDLEDIQIAANQAYCEQYDAAKAASDKAAAANEDYQKALNDVCNEYDGKDMIEKQKKLEETSKAKQAADAEDKTQTETLKTQADNAQKAAEAVEGKKEELRKSRPTDTSYVVLTARIECSFGKRESSLMLGDTHGVLTRQIPQLTVKDCIPGDNVITFGRCSSPENPNVVKAAEDAVADANKKIQENKDWRDHIVDFFVKPKEVKVTDSLLAQCEGECIMEFPANAIWPDGHEKVTINGDAPLLRRCELMCKYGGLITILLSGQPE